MQGAELYTIFQQCSEVYIDTRKPIKGGLFFALGRKDEQGVHRGNEFAEAALASGQAAFVVINDRALKERHADDGRFVLVEDCEVALQALAKYHRKQLDLPVLAIAGSNGKTTTKELMHSVLAQSKKVFSTRGNLNNHLGVPLSLLSVDDSYGVAILEVGANHLEETRFLAELIQPDYGLVTNCGKDHLGEYGSVENIVKANKELYDVLEETNAVAFVHSDNGQLMQMSAAVERRVLYGTAEALSGTIIKRPMLDVLLKRDQDEVVLRTQLFGAFWLDTVLNVSAVALELGCSLDDVVSGIAAYKPAALRSELLTWRNGEVVLDCYNANPSSMEVFLDEIETGDWQKKSVLVLGEMLELGDFSKTEHQQLVARVASMPFEQVVLVGPSFDEVVLPNAVHANEWIHVACHTDAASVFQEDYSGCSIYVKGSRGNKLEQIFGRKL